MKRELPTDPDVVHLLTSPAERAEGLIWVSDVCARRVLRRQYGTASALRETWPVKLRVRQLLETGVFRNSAPRWLPSDIARHDAYVAVKDGEELIALTRHRDQEGAYNAVTCFSRACTSWRILPSDAHPTDGHIRVGLTNHAVDQYARRVAGGCDPDAVRRELGDIIRCGRVLPEVPTWFDGYNHGGIPAYWVVVGDWLVLSIEANPTANDRFDASTCMHRDMFYESSKCSSFQQQLFEATVPLRRQELREQAEAFLGRSLPAAA